METVKLVATSLPVPSVQELSKESALTVPCRYHRLDLDPPVTNINTELPSVPVIDLQKLLMEETSDEELQLLHSTCKEWGFFQEELVNYCSQLQKVAITLFRLMARALKLDEEKMEELFYDGYQSCRINYYPSCPEPERVIGLSAHYDVAGLSLLIQANETQGLEIAKDGKWVPIKPLPNAILGNVGGIVEVLSNGVYRSNLHRATVNSEHERISVVVFHSPSFEKEIGPARSLIDHENPPLFKHIMVGSYYKEFYSRELKDKSLLDHLKI